MFAPQVVPPEKVDKLIGVLLKLYMKIGEVVDDGTESKGEMRASSSAQRRF
jgi:hypothetical protein